MGAGTLPAHLPSLPMGLDLRPERRELIERVRELAQERFAPRAAHYDATDLTFYIRHDNDDQVLATIGRAALGLPFDASFYKP